MMAIRILTASALLLTLTGCPKQDFPVNVPTGFLFPVTITPSSRTMRRGDTLWLEASFPDSLLETNSRGRYQVQPQNLKFASYIAYQQLLGVDQNPVGIAHTFRIVEKIGRAPIGGTFSGRFEPVYDGHSYRARIGLIPTQAGVTDISLLVGPADEQKGRTLPFIKLQPSTDGRPQQAVLDKCYYVINEGKATNLDLYGQYAKPLAPSPNPGPNTIAYETGSHFTVEVK